LGRLGISQNSSTEYEDLVSQGLMGLIEAIDRFNPEFGTQFSTYATVRVRGKILDHLRSMDWLSRTSRQRSRAVQDTISEFWLKNQREPTDEEIANESKLDIATVQQALVDSSHTMVSLDSVIDYDDGDDASLHETLPDETQPNPEEVFGEEEMRQRLVIGIKKLSEREQLVLSLYYYDELTLKEIGAILGITESRVCQLHARAITHLKVELSLESAPGEHIPSVEALRRKNSPKTLLKKERAAYD
jgi:RNA polymerase sigma factor for flagellar operon FliA